mgnify:FL=1
MKTRFLFLALIVVMACAACGSAGVSSDMQPIEAKDPPEEFALYQSVQVLAIHFIATESGYDLSAYTTFGAPSLDVDQNRDVIVRVYDAEGEILGSVTVFNPREIHTAGSDKPDRDVIPEASFTLFFENPQEVRSVEVVVERGPNQGFKQTFDIDPERLKFLTP